MDRDAAHSGATHLGAAPLGAGGERTEAPRFSRPVRQIVQMLVVLALVGAGSWAIWPNVSPVFLANPFLNGMIAAVFVVGVVACFLQVFTLMSSVRWIEEFARSGQAARAGAAPRLLAPLAALLRSRGAHRKITSASAASMLDSVATRIEEAREITRYLVSLLIFLGLLGTFYGLATVVPGVVETIRSLAPQDSEGGVEIFTRLMSGLEVQLEGMGTAFSSSLLGLAGSLVVGLLELFSARGQNRFYRELEEWMSSITRLGFAGDAVEGAGEGGGYEGATMVALLDHMAEQMEAMRALIAESAAARGTTDDKLSEVAVAVSALTRRLEHGDGSAEALGRMADGQEALLARLGEGGGAADALARVAEGQEALLARLGEGGAPGEGIDAESRMRLRSIDVQLLRLLEELAAGRQETVADIRADLAALARELRRGRGAGIGGGDGGGGGAAPGRPRGAAAGPGD